MEAVQLTCPVPARRQLTQLAGLPPGVHALIGRPGRPSQGCSPGIRGAPAGRPPAVHLAVALLALGIAGAAGSSGCTSYRVVLAAGSGAPTHLELPFDDPADALRHVESAGRAEDADGCHLFGHAALSLWPADPPASRVAAWLVLATLLRIDDRPNPSVELAYVNNGHVGNALELLDHLPPAVDRTPLAPWRTFLHEATPFVDPFYAWVGTVRMWLRDRSEGSLGSPDRLRREHPDWWDRNEVRTVTEDVAKLLGRSAGRAPRVTSRSR